MTPLGPVEVKALCIAGGYNDHVSPVPPMVEAFNDLKEKETMTTAELALFFEVSFRLMLSDYNGLGAEATAAYSNLVATHGVETFRPPEPAPAEIEEEELP